MKSDIQHTHYTNSPDKPGAGISAPNRKLLALLSRKPGIFTVSQGSQTIGRNLFTSRRLFASLASGGWLKRISHGLYAVPPLEADRPAEWAVDPWIMAHFVYSPCYIGGWSACEFWDFTEQIFRDIVIFTSHSVRNRNPNLHNIKFVIKTMPKIFMFGTRHIWRDKVQISISDPSRTIIDILDDPSIGGGIRQTADMFKAYMASQHKKLDLLMEYCSKINNRTIYKRLGYLAETFNLAPKDFLAACQTRISTGYSLLDPAIKDKGRIVRRWNLNVNAVLPDEGKNS